MSGPWHPTGRARVNPTAPEAQGVCDRCGLWYSMRDLVPQYQWQGLQLQNIGILVCTATCLDVPQIQLKTIILPPDPMPLQVTRPEAYHVNVPSFITTESLNTITAENANPLINEIEDTPTPDPNNPVLYPDE
jgi:hypothetical protein